MDFEEERENEKNWLARTRVNPEKFFFLYEKYYVRILSYLFRYTNDQDLAEDLTSETFLKAQQKLWQFRWQNATFGGWLFKIATNEAIQYFRLLDTCNLVYDSEIEALEPDARTLASLIAEEDLKFVFSVVDKWSDENRTIFMLRFWEGLSLQEIAEAMRITERSVRNRTFRGREDLKYALQKKYEDEESFAAGKRVQAFIDEKLGSHIFEDNGENDQGVGT